ncbi:MAG TPA: hypothetical protein VFU12_09460 [Glycomyces sp.]|nr:hypothetical protein [Glycomyces sp.]
MQQPIEAARSVVMSVVAHMLGAMLALAVMRLLVPMLVPMADVGRAVTGCHTGSPLLKKAKE